MRSGQKTAQTSSVRSSKKEQFPRTAAQIVPLIIKPCAIQQKSNVSRKKRKMIVQNRADAQGIKNICEPRTEREASQSETGYLTKQGSWLLLYVLSVYSKCSFQCFSFHFLHFSSLHLLVFLTRTCFMILMKA